MSDTDLLRCYAEENSNAAFATLVERHVNLVYSVARRHVNSPALAEDVAQSVFIELARNARRIKSGAPLVAWLHLVARRTAINVARGEMRRLARETVAAEIAGDEQGEASAAMKTNSSAWNEIEPLLDEAVESLNAPDRSAILLRFFENKSLREIGATLGSSEDAAQKRVTRALDQLRTWLVRRGLTVSAAGLATDLSAHAIHTAPIALGSAIAASTATIGPAALQATAVESAKTLVMTTLQKSAIGTALAIAVGVGIYEAALFIRQRSEFAVRQEQTSRLDAQLQSTRGQQSATVERLKSVESQIDRRIAQADARFASGDAALEAQMKTWLANLDRLRQIADQRPNLRIPELKLLSDENWFNAAAGAKLETEAGIREAFSQLRQKAENLMVNRMRDALGAFVKTNGGLLPSDVSQLLPFFDPPVEADWFTRYEMLQTGKLSELTEKNRLAVIGLKTPADVEYDSVWKMGIDGFMSNSAMSANVDAAGRAFALANNGQTPTSATQLMPFLKWPASEEAVRKFFRPKLAGPKR